MFTRVDDKGQQERDWGGTGGRILGKTGGGVKVRQLEGKLGTGFFGNWDCRLRKKRKKTGDTKTKKSKKRSEKFPLHILWGSGAAYKEIRTAWGPWGLEKVTKNNNGAPIKNREGGGVSPKLEVQKKKGSRPSGGKGIDRAGGRNRNS